MKRFLNLASTLLLVVCLFTFFDLGALAGSASGEDGVWIDFSTATDEELEEALTKIKAEQRARLKTKILLDAESLSLAKGKTAKITAQLVDVPEGLKAGKVNWMTSDAKIASCQAGSVRGVANGNATITASCTLSDGTVVYSECNVTVFTPITTVSTNKKSFDIGVGESVETSVTIQPKDASYTTLAYASSDEAVAVVSEHGVITGVGPGKATVTATTTDGSNKSVSFAVTATKKDDRGVTKTDRDGNTITLIGYKESKGSYYAKPENGNIFVLVELEIANKSKEEIAVSSILSFDAYCDGYTCNYSFSAIMNASNQMDGSIAPGKRMRGQIGFEVPVDWKELEVHYSPDVWSSKKVEFVIYHQ